MRSAWLEINFDAYRANLRAIQSWVDRPLLAVVKANAYGHGLVPIAQAAAAEEVWGLGVAIPAEGVTLREAGIRSRIVVLTPCLGEQSAELVRHDLQSVISSAETAEALAAAARSSNRTALVHVKVDTGMARVGLPPEPALDLCQRVMADPHLRLAGVMTHLARAEDPDHPQTLAQWDRFRQMAAALVTLPGERPVLHAANSAACVAFPQARFDLVRPGLLTYGILPVPCSLEVTPALSLKARLVQISDVPAGQPVSYGGEYVTKRESRLAIAPLGYADGLPLALSNCGWALVGGRRAPIRGRVCMDQVVLDVTDIPSARVGEEAVFIGSQGDEVLTVTELAETAGTISHEILTRLSERLPRVSVHEREVESRQELGNAPPVRPTPLASCAKQ